MQHLDEGTIHAWLDGALSATESADVERHAAECDECAALVAEARGMIAGATRIVTSLDVVRGGVIPKAPSGARSSASLWRSLRLTPARAALAATVLIAVSTLLAVRHDTVEKIVPMAAKSPVVAAPSANPTPAPGAPAAVAVRAAEPPAPARDVADARARSMDSVSPAPSKKAVASAVQPLNSPAAQNAVAAASPASVPTTPPVAAAVASGAGVSQATMAEARRTLAKANVDSTRSAAASAARFAPRPERVMQLSEVVDATGSRAAATFAGCYQFARDSVFGSISLPERFALDSLRADTTLNVVRAVSVDGRPEGVIAGSRWSQASLNAINVRFAKGSASQTLTVRFPSGSPVGIATVNSDTPSRTLTVTRLSCRP